MSRIVELFGIETASESHAATWQEIVDRRYCPYLQRACIKTRKSAPDVAIGSCTVAFGNSPERQVAICPFRFLDKHQIFLDCLHLLTDHEPGNQLHIVPEVSIPGGNVDYFLVSAQDRTVIDFVGIEIQTLDTTGTVWPERQRFLAELGIPTDEADTKSRKGYGMNWKMTAKTTLVQLHHKVQTFESLHKRLVLVLQDHLLAYMRREFDFDHVTDVRLNDPIHIHSYMLRRRSDDSLGFSLTERTSTDTSGIAACLGLQADAKVELKQIVRTLESKLSSDTQLFLS